MGQAKKELETAPKLAIRLLGSFSVERAGIPVSDDAWGRPKTRTLLKVLLTEPGRIFSQDELIEALFPDEDPTRALRNLHGRISELRRALEPGLQKGNDSRFILRRGHGYGFALDRSVRMDTVDACRMEEEGDRLRREGKHTEAATVYEEALRCYRGEFLEEDRYEAWSLAYRESWAERRLRLILALADVYGQLGDGHRAAVACRAAFDLSPWRESILQKLMLYHRQAGERSEAIRVYKRGVEALRSELDVAPSVETVALYEDILRLSKGEPAPPLDHSRLAVLPLVNINPDPEEEYFAAGMTEELIYTLSQVRELRVIAQTSVLPYKNTRKTAAQIGRELGVGTLIEGSVRQSDKNVRITVQLIDAASEVHLWAERYDRPLRDVFAIQSEIAEQVAAALRLRWVDGQEVQIEPRREVDLEAYTQLLKGRHHLKTLAKSSLEKAIACFERALVVNPGYAEAAAGLAEAHGFLWFMTDASKESLRRAHAAADAAVRLDPNLPEACMAQAAIAWIDSKDYEEAERWLLKAIEFNPRHTKAHHRLGRLLKAQGRNSEALVEFLRAHELDPLSSAISMDVGAARGWMGQEDDAIAAAEQILDLDPHDLGARVKVAWRKANRWDWDGAEVEMREALRTAPEDSQLHAELAELLLYVGRVHETRTEMSRALELLATALRPAVVLWTIGYLHCYLGEFSTGLPFLEKAAALEPQHRLPHWWVSLCQCCMGKYEEALLALKRSEDVSHGFFKAPQQFMELWMECSRGIIFARMRRTEEARMVIHRLQAYPEGFPDRAYAIACVCFELGEADEGFSWLEEAAERKEPSLHNILVNPCFVSIRADARYLAVLERMGLPSDLANRGSP